MVKHPIWVSALWGFCCMAVWCMFMWWGYLWVKAVWCIARNPFWSLYQTTQNAWCSAQCSEQWLTNPDLLKNSENNNFIEICTDAAAPAQSFFCGSFECSDLALFGCELVTVTFMAKLLISKIWLRKNKHGFGMRTVRTTAMKRNILTLRKI